MSVRLRLVELLSTGLDFQKVANEADDEMAAEGEDADDGADDKGGAAGMSERVQMLAQTLVENLKEDEDFAESLKDAVLRCAGELPVHAPMIGLTVALMSLDSMNIAIIEASGTDRERKFAKSISPILKNRHLLLVTLLIPPPARL